ncbi:MAG: NifU family protein [Sphingomonadales bacterium]
MLIETEPTPNPDTLKFIPDRTVLETGGLHFADADTARKSPLASAIFELDCVAAVFLGSDFLSVTRRSDTDWEELKPRVLMTIMDHFVSGRPVIEGSDGDGEAPAGDFAEEDREIVEQIKAVLNEKVRPAVARDGGDIVFHGFRNGIVHLHLQGACAGCPSSTFTLKAGVENLLKYYVPEVVAVEAIS